MQPLISVIVPIYKVEEYLYKCVKSILAQTYTNLEIILVDDGSPDNCPAICDEFAAKDSRVTVVHKKNGGVSSARNVGLDTATGEYIGFVDGDDYIEPTMYETLYKYIVDNNTDVSVINCRIVDELGNHVPSSSPNHMVGLMSSIDFLGRLFLFKPYGRVCTKLLNAAISVTLAAIQNYISVKISIFPLTLLLV